MFTYPKEPLKTILTSKHWVDSVSAMGSMLPLDFHLVLLIHFNTVLYQVFLKIKVKNQQRNTMNCAPKMSSQNFIIEDDNT